MAHGAFGFLLKEPDRFAERSSAPILSCSLRRRMLPPVSGSRVSRISLTADFISSLQLALSLIVSCPQSADLADDARSLQAVALLHELGDGLRYRWLAPHLPGGRSPRRLAGVLPTPARAVAARRFKSTAKYSFRRCSRSESRLADRRFHFFPPARFIFPVIAFIRLAHVIG